MNHLRDIDFWLKDGPMLVALVVPYLTYRLLGRRIEQYKTVLSKELENHKSQLQYAFQLKFYEFQTRYSWLHQQRAEAIVKLYSLLARVEGDLNVWINSSHELCNQTEVDHYRAAEGRFQEMVNFFDEKRIYFDLETIDAVLVMVEATWKIYDERSNVQWPEDRVPELASWLKQHSTILKEHNIGLVMALLEERFRSLLEAEAPSYDLDRMRSPDGDPDKKQKSEPGFWRRIGRLWWRRPKDGAMGDETSD
jgi:hypothetical protein